MNTVSAIDPAMARALEAIDRDCREAGERKALRQSRIDADPRIVVRRSALAALKRECDEGGMIGAFVLFADMQSGRLAERSAVASLIKARIALIDKDRKTARQYIRDALFARRQHWTVTKADPGFLVLEQATLEQLRTQPIDEVKAA